MEDFQRHPLFFAGITWDQAKEWNDRGTWTEAYPEDLSGLSPEELAQESLALGRPPLAILDRILQETRLPVAPGGGPVRVLDAGSGLSNLPYVLALMGCEVTAIDFADTATRLNLALHPRRMAMSPSADVVGLLEERGVGFDAPRGSVSHLTRDWFDDSLGPGSFEVIYACNSLRLSRKLYWQRSLARFHDLLAPGGLLIVLNQNAVAVNAEVISLVDDQGFFLVDGQRGVIDDPENGPQPGQKRFVGLWPTG